MYVEHYVGPGEYKILVAAFEVMAAEIVSGQVPSLNGRSGCAIEHEDPLVQQLFEDLYSVVSVVHLRFVLRDSRTLGGDAVGVVTPRSPDQAFRDHSSPNRH
jgi:hypothetical protein